MCEDTQKRPVRRAGNVVYLGSANTASESIDPAFPQRDQYRQDISDSFPRISTPSLQAAPLEPDEDADAIRHFLASVRPIPGCDFGDLIQRGRAAIIKIAQAIENPERESPNAEECLTILEFLSAVVPSGDTCYGCATTDASSGHVLVLDTVIDVLRERLQGETA